MAKQRSKQFEPSKTGASKLGFDGEEDNWVMVKKQRVIIVLPSLPLPKHLTVEKPDISHSQAELRDFVVDTNKTTLVHTVVPLLPLAENFSLQKPATSHSQAEFSDSIVDMKETTPIHTVVPSLPLLETASVHTVTPSLPVTEHFILQKPAASQSQTELGEFIATAQETTRVHTGVSSLAVAEHCTLQKPATSQSQAELRVNTLEATLAHTMVSSLLAPTLQKPANSQLQAELRVNTLEATLTHTMDSSLPAPTMQKPVASQLRAELGVEMRKATLAQTVVPSLPITDQCTFQNPAISQSQSEIRSRTRKATPVPTAVPSLPVSEYCALQKPATSQSLAELRDFQIVEPEACPDFTAVDKPEIVRSRNITTGKAPAQRRSLQDSRMDRDRRMGIRRSHTSRKPIRFPRVMCSSVVMDNEKLRIVNLEKKVEKAGGLNEWVGSIGLGREFERMLKGQRMSKFQVANLTMEKLKQMGALAVGPRRKLIHAIQCVYHPHCLRPSF